MVAVIRSIVFLPPQFQGAYWIRLDDVEHRADQSWSISVYVDRTITGVEVEDGESADVVNLSDFRDSGTTEVRRAA